MIRVILPQHLQVLAGVPRELQLEVHAPITVASILDALESQHPALRGTLRDYTTGRRRPLVRFFTCSEDISNDPLDHALPLAVAAGKEPLYIVGAIAGG